MPSDQADFPFKVMVDDNFNYMDESERYQHGAFATEDEALLACRMIVDSYLQSAHEPGMRAEDLYESYTSFGADAFIRSASGAGQTFSSWDYAKQRCQVLCQG